MKSSWAAILLLPLAGCASGGGPSSQSLETLLAQVLSPYDAPGAPGAAVLVMEGDRVLARRGVGLRDVETGEKVTAATNFRLASVSKQFTAMAILLLAEERRLRLDDPVGKWLELPDWGGTVTVEHLLTHTSGIADYEDHMPSGLERQLLDEDVRQIVAGREDLYFPPGTSYRYSNSGYALLARVAEEASGESFPEVLRRRIFEPLGMSATRAHVEGAGVVPNRAFGHSRSDSGWRRTDQSLTSAVLGDGGVYSSVDDLTLWVREILEPRVFPPDLVRKATEPRVGTDDAAIRYGYGWRTWKRGGLSLLGHTGETIGFRNALVLLPGRKIAVVVLTNRNEGEPLEAALEVIEAVWPR